MHKTKLAAMLVFLMLPAQTAGIAAGSNSDETTCYSTDSADYEQDDYVPLAIEACSALIASTSGNQQATAYAVRGYWKTRLDKLDDALKDFDQAISINPKNNEFYDYRADAWRAKGDLQKALSNYQQSISVDPTYAAAYFGAGSVYEEMGQMDLARQATMSAWRHPPRTALESGRTIAPANASLP